VAPWLLEVGIMQYSQSATAKRKGDTLTADQLA
jgi:hypothetical protein